LTLIRIYIYISRVFLLVQKYDYSFYVFLGVKKLKRNHLLICF